MSQGLTGVIFQNLTGDIFSSKSNGFLFTRVIVQKLTRDWLELFSRSSQVNSSQFSLTWVQKSNFSHVKSSQLESIFIELSHFPKIDSRFFFKSSHVLTRVIFQQLQKLTRSSQVKSGQVKLEFFIIVFIYYFLFFFRWVIFQKLARDILFLNQLKSIFIHSSHFSKKLTSDIFSKIDSRQFLIDSRHVGSQVNFCDLSHLFSKKNSRSTQVNH